MPILDAIPARRQSTTCVGLSPHLGRWLWRGLGDSDESGFNTTLYGEDKRVRRKKRRLGQSGFSDTRNIFHNLCYANNINSLVSIRTASHFCNWAPTGPSKN
jgi:hypothetical protein